MLRSCSERRDIAGLSVEEGCPVFALPAEGVYGFPVSEKVLPGEFYVR